jgi:hypothetical protein
VRFARGFGSSMRETVGATTRGCGGAGATGGGGVAFAGAVIRLTPDCERPAGGCFAGAAATLGSGAGGAASTLLLFAADFRFAAADS